MLKVGKEISEIKSFGIVQKYFTELYRNIFKGKMVLLEIFKRILRSIEKCGIKSKKKGRKDTFLILQSIRISETELLKMAV